MRNPVSSYPLDRLLLNPSAADAKAFVIRPKGQSDAILSFVTGGVNGKSAISTAVGNLADLTEWVDGEFELHFAYGGLGDQMIATAENGVYRLTDGFTDE